ncbi:MAG: hypothetical protein IKL61_04535 [Clostridia bacterium]|nr:hypothetical protein [Clostridia bacterium]MBR6693199.1 hypothetical protein [Clostridia bacterium]
MKKIVAIILALVMVFALAACGGGGGGGSKKTPKPDPFETLESKAGQEVLVAVALNSVDDTTVVVKEYLNNVIGPALKMKFDFSEQLINADEVVTFIENEKVKGAVGIINLQTSYAKTVIEVCQDLGMYCHTQKSAFADESKTASATLGNCGASTAGMRDAYNKVMDELLADGANHSAVIYSCAATKKMAESHYYSSMAVLEAMQKKYGLKYDESIETIAASDYVKELTTGNNNVKINFVSGSIPDNVMTPLKTGNYDIFACVTGFQQFVATINDTEKAFGMDIKVVATVNLDDATKNGFAAGDLDYGIINPLTVAYAIDAVAIRNAVDGYADMYKDADGNAVQLDVLPWLCTSAEHYEKISKLDKDGTWVVTAEDAKNLCKSFNDKATLDDAKALLASLGDIDAILAKKGLA